MINTVFECEFDGFEYYISVESTDVMLFTPTTELKGIVHTVDTERPVTTNAVEIGDVIHVNGLDKRQIVIGKEETTPYLKWLFSLRISEAYIHHLSQM